MKAKLVLLFILTIVIGFILGWLTSAQVRLHKLQPVRMYLSDERFRDGFYKAIQPDEQQKAEIEKILDKYSRINQEFQSGIRKDLDSNMKAFRRELDSKLTKEQLARLREMDERRLEMIKQNMRRRGDSTYMNRMRQEDHKSEFQRRSFPGDRQGPPPPPKQEDTVK